MECRKCGKEMYHEQPNREFDRFIEFYYCGECKLRYEITRSLSMKIVKTEWIDISKMVNES